MYGLGGHSRLHNIPVLPEYGGSLQRGDLGGRCRWRTYGDGTLDERLYVVQDANYNVTALFDNSGNVVERYVYDPFGQATVRDAGWNVLAGSTFAWVYLHQGGRFDATSGLYHFRHRDYSPTLGRWTSLDPIRYDAGDVNLYRALGNGLTNRLDPSGLIWYPGKYLYQYYREWRRGRELDAKLYEVQRRRHDVLAATMQSGGGTWSLYSQYGIADPACERNWRQGMGDAAVLANVGVTWAAGGPTWVSPSGQTFVWTSRGWVQAPRGGTSFNSAGQMPRASSRPVSAQITNNSCGPQCVTMVLDTLQPNRTPTAWVNLNFTAAGTRPSDLVRLLQANGVNASVQRGMTVNGLAAATSQGRPVIAHVNLPGGGGHFVVVDGVTTRGGQQVVAIRDPWGGRAYHPRVGHYI